MKESIRTILRRLPGHIRAPMERAEGFYEDDAREIILRAGRPLAIECADKRVYLSDNGVMTDRYSLSGLLTATHEDILTVFKSICDYSVYARQNELNSGYITIENGVRVGVCGTVVENDGRIINIKDLTTLSFRVSAEMIGCADGVLDRIDPLDGVLVCGPPCSGKTTLIRDMARRLSCQYKVSVIDERNEISATSGGVHSFDIGMSDVFVGMRKGGGAILALRSLSPDIIVCDELGDQTDAGALCYALRCGAAIIATVHARGMDDLRSRPITSDLLKSGAFRYVIVLDDRHKAGHVEKIYELRGGCH